MAACVAEARSPVPPSPCTSGGRARSQRDGGDPARPWTGSGDVSGRPRVGRSVRAGARTRRRSRAGAAGRAAPGCSAAADRTARAAARPLRGGRAFAIAGRRRCPARCTPRSGDARSRPHRSPHPARAGAPSERPGDRPVGVLSHGDVRLVRDDAGLVIGLVTFLDRLQHRLTYAGGHQALRDGDRPKSEDDITDWIKRRIEDDLPARVVPERELQVMRRKTCVRTGPDHDLHRRDDHLTGRWTSPHALRAPPGIRICD